MIELKSFVIPKLFSCILSCSCICMQYLYDMSSYNIGKYYV